MHSVCALKYTESKFTCFSKIYRFQNVVFQSKISIKSFVFYTCEPGGGGTPLSKGSGVVVVPSF